VKHRRMGRTGLHLSELTLGTMTFGKETDFEESARMVGDYLEAGGFVFDTADGYNGGLAEEYLGRHLKGRRDQAVVSTKVRFATGPGPNDRGCSRRHILDSVHQSLRRLQTDWIDVYFLHCWDPRTEIAETLSVLDGLVRDGKVRYLGASNFAAWQAAQALGLSRQRGWEPFGALQPQYSLICRSTERELLPLCDSERLGVFAWSPLGGGVLTGKYSHAGETPEPSRAADSARRGSSTMRNRFTDSNAAVVAEVAAAARASGRSAAQISLAWALRQAPVSTVLLGARTSAQLRDNLTAPSCELPEETWERLDEVSRPEPEYPGDFIAHSSAV
jgi:aryl-alcohol dehydrogenase-like predicted oxidoreductase